MIHSEKVRQLLLESDIPVDETWDLTPAPIRRLHGQDEKPAHARRKFHEPWTKTNRQS